MLTRRGLFRRAAQTALAAPIAAVAVHSLVSPLPELAPDPEPEPPRPYTGTGGDVVITGGQAGGSHDHEIAEINRRGWEAFHEGMTLQRALLGQMAR